MPIVRFLGRVLPSVVKISLDSVPQVDWIAKEINAKMHFTVSVVESVVDVKIDTNTYRDNDFGHFYNRAFDLARACVDTVAFATGHGLTVYLESFVKPDGTINSIMLQNPALATHCTFFKFPIVTQDDRVAFEKVLTTVFSEPAVFMALNDLIQANTLPHHGITNCARVLDGLRKLVVPGVDPRPAWPIFQATINADEAYLTFISKHSKNTRHGDRSFITGPITIQVVERTWIIMNRFLEFRKRGNQPLPLAEFPLLMG
jgi:hypothetical protein